MRKRMAAAAVAASMLGGAGVGLALSTPGVVSAQTSTSTATPPSNSAAAAPRTAPQWMTDALQKLVDAGTITKAQADSVSSALAAAQPPRGDHGRGPGGPGGPGFGHGPHELGDDLAIAAKAIGVSESDLTTAVQSGQSLAAVAKAHNVDPQKVIDALVSDEQAELADQVKNGTITQAQADQIKTGITQRVTDRVNGTGPGPMHRGDGPPPGMPPGAPANTTPTTTA